MSSLIRSFFSLNRKCYSTIAKLFPNTKFSAWSYWHEQVHNALSDGDIVLDVGGGRCCRFAAERKRFSSLKIIAVDISQEELDLNHDVDEKIVFDMASGGQSTLADGSVDMVVSHGVLEHLKNVENAIIESRRVLKPGGKFINVLPCKFALFALINQMIPHWLARKILFAVFPESKGLIGFKAYYNKCWYPLMQKLLIKHGFAPAEFVFQYHQSGYFSFFVPFALVSLLWDLLMYIFRIKPLCAYFCFTTHKVN